MRTRGRFEIDIREGIRSFEQEYRARRPTDIRMHLIADVRMVHLQGDLNPAEQQWVGSLGAGKGRDLLKQVRAQLIETARPVLEAMVREAAGVKAVSLHHHISVRTAGEVAPFTLANEPGPARRNPDRPQPTSCTG